MHSNKTIQCGIVSYLPDEPKLRERRKKIFKNTLDFLLDKYKNINITIISQGYEKEDKYLPLCLDTQTVTYSDKYPTGVSSARNVLLRKLYNSNEDFLLLLDDDSTLYPYYDGHKIVEDIINEPIITNLDLITSINPRCFAFRKTNIENRETVETSYTFLPSAVSVSFCLIRNLKKYYNKEIYFLEPKNGVHTFHEDIIFLKELIYNGLRVTSCNQLIQKTDNKDSVLFTEDTYKGHRFAKLETYRILKERFGFEYDLDLLTEYIKLKHTNRDRRLGQYLAKITRDFNRKHNVLKVVKGLTVPRSERYTFTEKDLDYRPPKNRSSTK